MKFQFVMDVAESRTLGNGMKHVLGAQIKMFNAPAFRANNMMVMAMLVMFEFVAFNTVAEFARIDNTGFLKLSHRPKNGRPIRALAP